MFAFKPDLHAKRSQWLLDSCKKLATNVQPWTPIHVIVWYHLPLAPAIVDELFKVLNGNIEFLQLTHEEWEDGDPHFMKKEIRNHHHRLRWTEGGFPIEYRRMGMWLSMVPFQYALAHGYEYCLKWDDDSFINAPVQHNMVEFLRSKKIEFAYRSMIYDGFGYLAGLAELTR